MGDGSWEMGFALWRNFGEAVPNDVVLCCITAVELLRREILLVDLGQSNK
jgi:hypothetical protein